LATDYDETIATDGRVHPDTLASLERFRASGRKLMVNTGRTLRDLTMAFPNLTVFDLVIVENGAVLYDPHTSRQTLLGEAPPAALLNALRRRNVPLYAGEVILESLVTHSEAIDSAIAESGVAREITYNKSNVIMNPPGVNKGSGLLAALRRFGIAPERTAGIGDAENDHALLAASGVPVAVPHAIPALKSQAHHIMSPIELIARILTPSAKHASDRSS
jgi:hypothetical protein